MDDLTKMEFSASATLLAKDLMTCQILILLKDRYHHCPIVDVKTVLNVRIPQWIFSTEPASPGP